MQHFKNQGKNIPEENPECHYLQQGTTADPHIHSHAIPLSEKFPKHRLLMLVCVLNRMI